MDINVAVSVDPYAPLPTSGDKPYVAELTSKKITLLHVSSGRSIQPHERMLLINLVNLFTTALPNMPRAHIIRTLFSQHTQCLAIVARGFVVRAGLAYHTLPQRGFTELVFVAAREEDRAKGYAAFLMRNLRLRLRVQTPKVDAILAYADNGARGWFARQGFGEVTLPHERWAGYIRDYDGAQLVQTYVHAFGEEVFERNGRGEAITVQGIPRCKLPLEARAEQWIVQTQHYAVRTEMYKRRPATGLVYSGLTFRPGEVKDPESIPGLAGRGLALQMYGDVLHEVAMSDKLSFRSSTPQLPRVQRLHRLLMLLVDTMKADAASEPFLHPVDASIAPGYNDLITKPMDLGTLQDNVTAGVYDPVGHGVKAFISDATRIFDNCREYNGDCSLYTVKAERLRRKLEKAVEKWKHIVCEVEEKTFVDAQMYR